MTSRLQSLEPSSQFVTRCAWELVTNPGRTPLSNCQDPKRREKELKPAAGRGLMIPLLVVYIYYKVHNLTQIHQNLPPTSSGLPHPSRHQHAALAHSILPLTHPHQDSPFTPPTQHFPHHLYSSLPLPPIHPFPSRLLLATSAKIKV